VTPGSIVKVEPLGIVISPVTVYGDPDIVQVPLTSPGRIFVCVKEVVINKMVIKNV